MTPAYQNQMPEHAVGGINADCCRARTFETVSVRTAGGARCAGSVSGSADYLEQRHRLDPGTTPEDRRLRVWLIGADWASHGGCGSGDGG